MDQLKQDQVKDFILIFDQNQFLVDRRVCPLNHLSTGNMRWTACNPFHSGIHDGALLLIQKLRQNWKTAFCESKSYTGHRRQQKWFWGMVDMYICHEKQHAGFLSGVFSLQIWHQDQRGVCMSGSYPEGLLSDPMWMKAYSVSHGIVNWQVHPLNSGRTP